MTKFSSDMITLCSMLLYDRCHSKKGRFEANYESYKKIIIGVAWSYPVLCWEFFSANHYKDPLKTNQEILLMAEILHHLVCMKP